MRGSIEGEDIVVLVGLLSKRSRKEQVLLPRSTATKMADTSNHEKQENDEAADHSDCEETLEINKLQYFQCPQEVSVFRGEGLALRR